MTLAQPSPLAPCLDITSDERGLGGLIAMANGAEQALPLASVRVRAAIAGGCCRTVIEQVFQNTLTSPMEAVHIFPLPEEGAVTEVELRCGEVVVRAECKEREAATAEFNQAREAGHRAALLTQERDDVHTLRVTNLPPGESVAVTIVVVEHLDVIDGRFRWRFPTTIPPRFLPGEPISHDGAGVLPDTDQAPDASRLQPPLRLAGGTTLDLEVSLAGPLSNLESSLHAIRVDFDGGLRVAPSGVATLNKDFALAFTTGQPDATAARAWTDGEHTLVVVDPPTVAMPTALPRDAVFVVDISGSMGGAKMAAAKKALKSALHGLIPGDRFHLIAFDDRLEFFSQQLTAYDERSLVKADRWIDRLSARGGTQMLPAIQAALDGETPQGRLRTVLFITDGQAWNEDQLVAAVAGRRKRAMFFTLGIDTAVNGALLKRLARVGGGTCELATPTDDIEAIIANLEARFGSPVGDEVGVEGYTNAALIGGTLFTGRPASVLIEGAPDSLTVTGVSAEGAWRMGATPTRIDFPIGALWARRRVAALQDRLTLKPFEEEAIRPQILSTALKYSIACRYTAFVAVERGRVVDGDRVEVAQPAELPESWDPAFKTQTLGGAGAGAPGAPPPLMRGPSSMSRSAKSKRARPRRSMAPSQLAPPPPSPASAASAPMDVMSVMDTDDEAGDMSFAEAPAKEAASPSVLKRLEQRLFGSTFDRRSAPIPEAAPFEAELEEEMEMEAQKPKKTEQGDPAAALAQSQGADGSFGGDVARTAAALLTLILLGHTRRKGLRRRTVTKAAAWLAARAGDAQADLALAALAQAERGQAPAPTGSWRDLRGAGPEGGYLSSLM